MRKVKMLVLLLSLSFLITEIHAQDKPLSPKETVKGKISGVDTEIVYCRPSARGPENDRGEGAVWQGVENRRKCRHND